MKQHDYYLSKITEIDTAIKLEQKQDATFSNYRLLGIVVFFGSFYFAGTVSPWWLILSGGIFTGFYLLVKKHEKVKSSLEQLNFQKSFYENEIKLSNGEKGAYQNGEAFYQENDQYASDLDVFGSFSLFQLFNRAATYKGIHNLKDRFLLKKDQWTTSQRQEATEEVAGKSEFYESLLSSLFALLSERDRTENVYNFDFTHDIKGEKFLKIYLMAIPFLWIAALAVGYFVGWTFFGVIAFVIMVVNYGIVGKYKSLSEYYFTKTEGTYRILAPLEHGVELVQSEQWNSPMLRELAERLPKSEENPIKTFGYTVKKLESRKNQFAAFFMYLYSPFDVKQLIKLKAWHAEQPQFFKDILDIIGEFEVICSYAICLNNNEDWSIPQVQETSPFELKGSAIGHPLLGNENVHNDFTIDAKNRLNLITGSNMSGKSTFLRAIGTNLLLAYMGAPVCAKDFTVSEGIRFISYMRIKDDLSLNVSTFKAEINRVKMIVDAINSGENYLFLIDEMLRGTNSEDKLKGAIALLRKIAESNTYALVATHDLRATEVSEEYPEVIKNFFFEFRNVGEDLEFDYKIKAGVCQSFNASQLLAKAGLHLDTSASLAN